jgi:hypothetical protein
MTKLVWDQIGERFYETGVDHGVLYIPNQQGVYDNGVAWNGLTAVTETPGGAEANAQYADNIKYLNLFSAEEFAATVEAFTYPDEFAQFDGLATPAPGVVVAQQARRMFGLSYRTRLGNDLQGDDLGYKIHLIYGCQASPSEKAYSTINDSPEPITFSWEVSTTSQAVTGHRPTSLIVIDSTKVGAAALTQLENLLYGTVGANPSLPTPDEVLALFAGTVQEVFPTAPTATGNDIAIPSTPGVVYTVKGGVVTGTVTITEDTVVTARPAKGYVFLQPSVSAWLFDATP